MRKKLTTEERQQRSDERSRRKSEQLLAYHRASLSEKLADVRLVAAECSRVIGALDQLGGEWAAADEDLVWSAERLAREGRYLRWLAEDEDVASTEVAS